MHKKFKISKNKIYDFLQIEPTPTTEEITKFYSDEFYSGDFKKFLSSNCTSREESLNFLKSPL